MNELAGQDFDKSCAGGEVSSGSEDDDHKLNDSDDGESNSVSVVVLID